MKIDPTTWTRTATVTQRTEGRKTKAKTKLMTNALRGTMATITNAVTGAAHARNGSVDEHYVIYVRGRQATNDSN